jgi:hypothetical protein
VTEAYEVLQLLPPKETRHSKAIEERVSKGIAKDAREARRILKRKGEQPDDALRVIGKGEYVFAAK